MSGLTPAGPHFIHNIDPVLFSLGPLATYYYGLAYTLGFLGLHLWLRLRRPGWLRCRRSRTFLETTLRGTAPAAEHLHLVGNDFRRVAIMTVTILPFAGPQASLNIYL